MNLQSPILKGAAHVGRTARRFRHLVSEDDWRQHRPVCRRQPRRRAWSGDVGAIRRCCGACGRHHSDRLFPQRLSQRCAMSSGTALRRSRCWRCWPSSPTTCGNAALAYLGINPSKPAVEFEIRLPKAALSDDSRHPDRIAHRPQPEARTDSGRAGYPSDGRSVLRGSVTLDYRTTDRVVVLNLPGQAQCEFKLRLAANPSRSDQFGPWHLADRVASPATGRFRIPPA